MPRSTKHTKGNLTSKQKRKVVDLVSSPSSNLNFKQNQKEKKDGEVFESFSPSTKHILVEISDEETETQTPIDKSIQSNLLLEKTDPSFPTYNKKLDSRSNNNDVIFNQYQSEKYPKKSSISLIEERFKSEQGEVDDKNKDDNNDKDEEPLLIPHNKSNNLSIHRMKKKLEFAYDDNDDKNDDKDDEVPSSYVCQEYLHSCVDYEREGKKALSPGQQKLIHHIRTHMTIPIDFEINKTYGCLSGLSYEERLIRAFFNKKLLPQCIIDQNEYKEWVKVGSDFAEEMDLEVLLCKEENNENENRYQKLFKDLYYICRVCGEKGHLYDYCSMTN